MLPATAVTQPFLTLLAETFGLSERAEGFFLDSGQAGLLGAVAALSAAAASAQRGPGDPSIAAHCGHVLYLLTFFAAFERGERPAPDWEGSWATREVDEAQWRALQGELRAVYGDLVERLRARSAWPEEAVGAMLMLLAHCAYHVGEIRQRIAWVAPQ